MNARHRILVAMSGGVDSSVAACLLHEQGHDVVGVFMRLGADTAAGEANATSGIRLPLVSPSTDESRHRGCCSAADATDARAVAGRLGIPFYALNFEQDFSKLIDYFADEYAAARTPNPCVMCNQWLKFGKLLHYADAVGADLIATGHYARLGHTGPRPRLLRARHRAKDQSYVLFGVPPDVLARTRLPIGELSKDEVRAHARRFGLALHDKPESQDICFVPDRAYERVVRRRRPGAFRPGRIRHVDGRDVGSHEGLPHFTIGQRRGLRVALGTPVYVTGLDAVTDTVTIGPREALESPTARGTRVNWLIDPPQLPFEARVQIRYNHAGADAWVNPLTPNSVEVEFAEPQLAVTPGQAMVFYRGDEVVGGGWIEGR